MTTAQTLIAVLRSHVDGDHEHAERILTQLDPHQLAMLARASTVLLADAVRLLEGGDRAGIDAWLQGAGLVAAQMCEVSG